MTDGPLRWPRRRLLLAAGLGALGCSSDAPKEGLLGGMERFNERIQAALFNPHRLARELPPGSETPYPDFPKYFMSPTVPLAPASWRLQVGGEVRTRVALSVEELQRLGRTNLRVRHHCVEGWSAVASWQGLPVRELARAVGAHPQARFVEFRSFDQGYWSSWDRGSALHPQTLLAWGMNGAPLTPEHGAPLRLYSAVKLGYKMVKYLTQVNFLDQRTGGFWEDRGYEWFAGV